jgi:hypothetical protein
MPPALLLGWFVFMSSTPLWIPAAHDGTIVRGESVLPLAGLLAFVGGLVGLFVRERLRSVDHAVLSAIPALVSLALAVIAGSITNDARSGERGEPIHLYYGIALWASWAALILATAMVARTRWGGPAGILVSLLVAVLGYLMFTARTD